MYTCVYIYGMALKGKKLIRELEIKVSFTKGSSGLQWFSNINSRQTHPHYLKMVFKMFTNFFCHVGLMKQGT